MDEQNQEQPLENNLDNNEGSLNQGLDQGLDQGMEQDINVVAEKAEFEEFDEAVSKSNVSNERLNLLKDLQLNVFIELGRTKMQIKDILELERGYVIELDKLASEPVDIFVNNKKIAEGEVVVIDKHFGIRIINLSETSERLKGIY